VQHCVQCIELPQSTHLALNSKNSYFLANKTLLTNSLWTRKGHLFQSHITCLIMSVLLLQLMSKSRNRLFRNTKTLPQASISSCDKKVVFDVAFNKHTVVGKNLPPVLHTFSKKGYESSLKHKWVRLCTKWKISMKSKRNVSHSFNSVSTHIVTPTKQSASESTRNKIHAIKRIELPRDFMIHLSESILAKKTTKMSSPLSL